MRNKRYLWAVALFLLISAAMFFVTKKRGALGLFGKGHPDVLYTVPTAKPVVALTIDDSPDALTTRAILDVLAHNAARATFFMITDRIAENEAVVRELVAAGHEIGNHMTRDEPSIDLSRQDFESELRRAHHILSAFASPRWYRPGSGWYDEEMLAVVARHGYRCALGSIYPLDAHLPFPWLAAKVILCPGIAGAQE
jgi:peptidoglycan/xylan/chitin deacetylase (PgdA/CDA1 family)